MAKLNIKKTKKLTRIAYTTSLNIEKGDQVKWLGAQTDYTYVVKDIEGNMVYLVNDKGVEIEALDYEVVKV